jgi:hypothetical protein
MRLLCRIFGHKELALTTVKLPSRKPIRKVVWCVRCGEKVRVEELYSE